MNLSCIHVFIFKKIDNPIDSVDVSSLFGLYFIIVCVKYVPHNITPYRRFRRSIYTYPHRIPLGKV